MDNEQFTPPNEQQLDPIPPAPPVQKKHSGLGIASFIIAMVSILLTIAMIFAFVAFGGASAIEQFTIDPMMTEEDLLEVAPGLIIAVLLFMAAALISFIGGILGIAALFQKNRKKLFAILGVIFNFFGWAVFLILFIIGLVMQAAA